MFLAEQAIVLPFIRTDAIARQRTTGDILPAIFKYQRQF